MLGGEETNIPAFNSASGSPHLLMDVPSTCILDIAVTLKPLILELFFFELCCLGLPRSDRPSVSDLLRRPVPGRIRSSPVGLSAGYEQRLTNGATGSPKKTVGIGARDVVVCGTARHPAQIKSFKQCNW